MVSYISNFSFVREPSFVVMREHLLGNFDDIWIDNLNGDSRETGKLTPEGAPDPSVFSTDYNREGIRKGTSISLLIKRDVNDAPATVRYRDWWGTNKREALLESLDDPQRDSHYIEANPSQLNRYSFRPDDIAADYASWPKLSDLAHMDPMPGVEECRAGALFDIDKNALAQRIERYFDKRSTLGELEQIAPGLARKSAGFDPTYARTKLLAKETYDQKNLIRYAVRPFDSRWCYHSTTAPMWNRSRPDLRKQLADNRFIVSRVNCAASPEGMPITFSSVLMDKQMISRNPGAIPFVIQAQAADPGQNFQSWIANLSTAARNYLAKLGLVDPDSDREIAELIWLHALAIGYSPAYIAEHADGIRSDWPRIPLPATREALQASAKLGREVAALLDTETPVPGVTAGKIRDVLQPIAVISRKGDGALQLGEFKLTAGWGHAGKAGVTMPGKGRIEPRTAHVDELDPHLTGTQAASKTFDVFLNPTAYWKNVPVPVWEFTIGGYQVMKKWLSYREFELLGRALSLDEIKEVGAMARRLAALVLLQPALDDNYQVVSAATYPWPGIAVGAGA